VASVTSPELGGHHELNRDAQLPPKLNGKIDGDAVRLAVRILDDEEGRRGGREDAAAAKLAGGNELFHCRALLRGGAPATIAAANSIPHDLKNFTNASHQKLLNRRNSAGALTSGPACQQSRRWSARVARGCDEAWSGA
jgi:hypothetical protein